MNEAATATLQPLRAAFRSDPGRVRSNNEDLPLLDAERGVYGVIDGVGGQAAGEFAAAIACDVILQRLARPLGTPAERVRESIAIANNEIFKRAGSSADLAGMTCVVTLAIVNDGQLTIGHVGDSRLYKIRADGIRKLTHDHSPVGEREDAQQISEADAMRHPRRHEVFRDVGGALRDKDEDDYVEVIEDVMERDAAILLCSDGLTDMVPSATIDRIVREHAGQPETVVDALIAAANEAGGRDNVTVVYAEGPDFPRAVQGRGTPPAGSARGSLAASSGHRAPDAVVEPRSGTAAGRFFRWIAASRTTWFALGAVAGVLAALLLVWRAAETQTTSARTIAVAPIGTDMFSTLAAAAAATRAGDVLRLEEGSYAEAVTLGEGVSLVARVPGTVTFVRPAVSGDDWVAIRALGGTGGRIAGIRIESTPELPVDVGIRVAGQSRAIELVEIDGPMRVGVEILGDASASLAGSQFSVAGSALVLGERAQIEATGNVFLRGGRTVPSPPVSVAAGALLRFRNNVFVGFGADIVKGLTPAERQQFLAANVIVPAEPSTVR